MANEKSCGAITVRAFTESDLPLMYLPTSVAHIMKG